MFFANIGVSANAVTVLSFFIGLTVLGLFIRGGYIYTLVACLMYLFFNVLDHVDGNIARLHESTNYYGKYLNSITGTFIGCTLDFAIAIGISAPLWLNNQQIIITGALSCLFACMTSILDFRFASLLAEIGTTTQQGLKNDGVNSINSLTKDHSKFVLLKQAFGIIRFVNVHLVFFLLVAMTVYKTLEIYLLISIALRIFILAGTFVNRVFLRRPELNVYRPY